MISWRYMAILVSLAAPMESAFARALATSDQRIAEIKQIIDRGDIAAFTIIVPVVEYMPEWNSDQILGAEAFVKIAGCRFKSQSRDSDFLPFMTELNYSCPKRQKLPCTTGHLKLMVYDDDGGAWGIKTTKLGLSEDRITGNGCPLPPAPPPVNQ